MQRVQTDAGELAPSPDRVGQRMQVECSTGSM
jgi:hypothetical protein